MSDDREAEVPRLNPTQAEQLAGHLAEVEGGPLVDGLRAAASEASDRRVSHALRVLAASLERGESLENILDSTKQQWPRHFSGLVAAAVRTGQFGESLGQLIEHHRVIRSLRQSVLASLAYPAVVLALTALLVAMAFVFIVPQFDTIYKEFELELPAATLGLIWWSRHGMPIVVCLLGAVVLGLLVVRLVSGAIVWRRFVATVPVVGSMAHWSSVAEWTRLLAILVEQRIPLPEALRLAGDGVGDANVRDVSRKLAEGAEDGRQLSRMIADSQRLPALLIPLVRWGEYSGTLTSALSTASEMYVARVRQRSMLFRSVLPPLVFILVAFFAGWLITSIAMPMVWLLQSLG